MVAGTIFIFVLIDLIGYLSSSTVKSVHFYTNGPTCKKERLIFKCDGLLFSLRSELIAGTIVTSVHIDLSGHFKLNSLIFTAVPTQKQAYRSDGVSDKKV